MAEEKKEKLFDMFEPTSTEAWKAKIIADLKGADFDKKLVWRTNEGFNVQPFYRLEDVKDLPTSTHIPVNSRLFAAHAITMTGSSVRASAALPPRR